MRLNNLSPARPERSRGMLWAQLLLALLLLSSDQATKFWAVKYLVNIMPVFNFLNLIKLDLELAFNQGVSWGLFSAHNLMARLSLIAAISVILIYLIFYTKQRLRAGKTILAESLIIAGAISNLIDRLYYGAVIDFIHVSFKFNNLNWDFPIFNLADVGIFIGVCCMLFREYYPEKNNLFCKNLATLGDLGNWQAPGTWGTLAAVPVVFLARQYCNNLIYLGLVITVIISAYLIIYKSSNYFPVSDDQTIIIDEFAGFWCCFIITCKFSLLVLVLNFLIFRFFDISKIWPVNLAEKLPGALGVLADDLVAGLLTNLSWVICVKYIFC